MSSSLFRFSRVAFASMLLGLVAGACLSGTQPPVNVSKCAATADCRAGSECSAGVCVPYTACMTDAQCSAGQQCSDGACRSTCSTDAQCTSLGFICSLPAGQCIPNPNPPGGDSGGQGGGSAGSDTVASGSGGMPVTGAGGGATGGAAQTGPTSDLVDDLEDNDARIIVTAGRQGSWYAFSDGSITPSPPDDNGNTNAFAPGSPGANSSQHAAHVSSQGFPNYAGVAVDFNNSGVRPKDTANRKVYDVSAYDGIVFQAKGTSSGQMRVMAVTKQIAGTSEGGTCDDSNTANHCWDSYGQNFDLTSDWTEVRIRFSDMTTDNSSPFDLTSVYGLAFQDNAQNGSLDLWIDDVALFKDGTAVGGSGGAGNTSGGSGNTSGGMSAGGSDTGMPTSCSLPGSASPGSGSFTWYYFGQGTTQQNGMYKTGCGYTGTESGMTDTVSNIVSPHYFAAIPGKNGFDTVGHCGECVKITNGGKSIVATVIDECPTDNGQNPACTPDHLDLSWQAWNDLGYSVGNPSGTTWQFVPCQATGNVQISFNSASDVYVQNMIVPIQSVSAGGQMGNHTSYGSWQFSQSVQGQTLTITDVAGRTITVTANAGNTGKQFPACN
jgi:hypothetical protein